MTVKHPAFSHWWRHSEGGSDTSPCLYVEICQDMTCLDFWGLASDGSLAQNLVKLDLW